MLLKECQQRFRHCQNIEKEIDKASADRLRQIKDELNDTIPESTGMFNFALPLVISTFFMVLSFAVAQFSLWEIVVRFLGLDSTVTMILLVISSIVCAIVWVIPVFVMAKGYMVAVKVHIWLAWTTLAAAIVYVFNSLLRAATVETGFIAPLLSLAFIAASFLIIRSQYFYNSLLFTLMFRVVRKLSTEPYHAPPAR